MRKPIVSTVYAASCALAVCGGFIVANTTHSETTENTARHVEETDEEMFGLVDNLSIRPRRDPDTQDRPQPGLPSSSAEEAPPPEHSDATPQDEADSPPPEPAVSPAGSGQTSNSGNTRSNSGQYVPAPPLRLPNRPGPGPVAPVPEPLVIPDIPFPTLTINQLPVDPPKPEPLRPLQIG